VGKLGIIGAELSRQLNLTPSAVSKLISRGSHDSVSKELETHLLS
jgi:hypothetical protein